MADLRADLQPGHRRGSLWARLKEERFTNVDLLVVLGALVITGFVGALSGAALFG
jgi:hypothetical protein